MELRDGANLEGKQNVKVQNRFTAAAGLRVLWRVITMADRKENCELKQDKQCTCDVTLRRVRLIIFSVEKQ